MTGHRAPVPGGTSDARRAAVAVVVGATLWATTGIAQELGASSAAPPAVAAIRTLGGGASLLVVAAATTGHRGTLDTLRRGGGALAVATVAMATFQLGYLGAVRATGVAVGVLVAIGSAPAWAGLYDALRGRFPGRRWVVATALSVVAAGLLLSPTGAGGVDAGGILLALIAGLAYAVYAIASKHLLDRGVAGIPVMALAILGSGILLSPALVVTDLSWLMTPAGGMAAVWLSVVAVGASYVAFVWGLARLATPVVTTLTLAEPLVAALLAVLLLGERLTGAPLFGAALLVVGLVIVSVGPASGAVPPTRASGV